MPLVPNERFGVPQVGRSWGRVLGTIAVDGEAECNALLRAVEAGLRIAPADPILRAKRLQLLRMRWRAFVEDWSGWA